VKEITTHNGKNVGIPDNLKAPSRTRSGPADPLPGELFRLLQRPCDLLSTLEFPAQDFYQYECNPKAELLLSLDGQLNRRSGSGVI